MANGHGGRRQGAGRPKKPLAEKILEGTTDKHRPKVVRFGGEEVPDIEPPKWLDDYGSKIANEPDVPDIFKSTVEWLKQTGCLNLINPELIADYAISKSHWYEAQRMITKLGLVYTPSGKIVESNPLIDVAAKFYKLADAAWDKIWRIVAANSEEYFGGENPGSDLMEKLLKMNLEE